MAEFVIVDECLVPRRLTWMDYKGPDPLGFLKDFRKNLRFVFEVSTTRCEEKKLMWDYTGDPIHFYTEWLIRKELSSFTNMRVTIRIRGHVSKAKKDGDFTMEVYGEVENKFKPNNWFMKYVWIMYNKMFYGEMRKKYAHMCRDYINSYLNWCKEKHNMKAVTTPDHMKEEFEEEVDRNFEG